MLTRLGLAYVKFLCRPEKASAIRMVIAIAERMPELGRKFYESGPAEGIAKLAAYIEAQVEAGDLGGGGLRNRRRAADGSVPGDAVQIDGFQLRFGAKPASRSSAWCGSRSKTFLAAYRAPAKI